MPALQMVPIVNKQGRVQAVMGVPKGKKTKGKGSSTKATRMAGNGAPRYGNARITYGKGSAGLLNFTW